jgi:hypothetical protein
MNVKLFEEHMVKKYPSLVSEVKKDKKKIWTVFSLYVIFKLSHFRSLLIIA